MSFQQRSTNTALDARLRRAAPTPPALRAEARAFFELGRQSAPLFAAFVAYVIESAHRAGHETICYFTREGEFFAALHRRLTVAAGWRDAPRPRVLQVSRLATFLPSLAGVDAGELMRLWRQYRQQSPAALWRSLGLPLDTLESLTAAHGLEPEAAILHPWQDRAMLNLLTDARFQAIAEPQRRQRQALLQAYLRQEGVGVADSRAAVVDIGWHGSIQENLARVAPAVHFDGYYFGVMPRRDEGLSAEARALCPPPAANAARHSFVHDVICAGHDPLVADRFLTFVGPLEMLCNSPEGTVVGYDRREGRVVAVRRNSPEEDAVHHARVRHFQAGVLATIRPLVELTQAEGASPAALQYESWRILRRLMIEPPRWLARTFARLHHDETYGLGRCGPPRRTIALGLPLRALVSARSRATLRELVMRTPWPHALLIEQNLAPLCHALNWRYFRDLYDIEGTRRRAA